MEKAIILIGSRGTGKSTLGQRLADELDRPFVDLDDFLEEQHQALSLLMDEAISWEEFRKLESEALRFLLPDDDLVLATGGGTAESEFNRHLIHSFGTVIYLNGDENQIDNWIQARQHRPSYQNSTQKDMKRRHPLYKSIADAELWVTPWDENALLNEIQLLLGLPISSPDLP